MIDLRDQPVVLSPDRWRPGVERVGVTLICLHQLGCELGTSARQRAAAGSREAARVQRCRRLPYHAVALRTGEAVLVHPLARYTYHAGNLNRLTVGLGIEGRYPLAEAGRAARHSEWAEAVEIAAIECGLLLAGQIQAAGSQRVGVVTHRQSSRHRLADPGEMIVRRVGLALERHGLTLQRDETWGDGSPWPAAWR